MSTGSWEVGGTPGFWKNWDSHNTYTRTEIEGWIGVIDGDSYWLVPDLVPDTDGNGIIDINDMEAILIAGQGGTEEQKFLRHYLTTRLNVAAGRLFPDTFHLFSSYDPHNYLGLGGQGNLGQIIAAIESKYHELPLPSDGQFGIMKNICDRLNDLGF